MSTRFGMADSRSFTVWTSSSLYNNQIQASEKIEPSENYKYRMALQEKESVPLPFPQIKVSGADTENGEADSN